MDFIRFIMTEEMEQSFFALCDSYDGKNENDIQRKFALFMNYAKENQKINYFDILRKQSEKGDIKTKLINSLKFVGEPNKADCIYFMEWCSLIERLKECDIIDNEQSEKIINKLEKIIVKVEND